MLATTTNTGWAVSVSGFVMRVEAFAAGGAGSTVAFTVAGVGNPGRSSQVTGFTVDIRDSANALIAHSNSSSVTSFTLTPDQLAFTASFGSPQVSTRSALTLVITPKTAIPAGGKLQVRFQSTRWSYQALTQPFVETPAPNCQNGAGTGVACSQDPSAVSYYQINLDSLFPAANPALAPFTLVILNVLSPPTVNSPNDPLTVTTLDSSNFRLDVGSLVLTGLAARTVVPTVPATSGVVLESTPAFSVSYNLPVAMTLSDQVVVSY